jgi:hypothetical protein
MGQLPAGQQCQTSRTQAATSVVLSWVTNVAHISTHSGSGALRLQSVMNAPLRNRQPLDRAAWVAAPCEGTSGVSRGGYDEERERISGTARGAKLMPVWPSIARRMLPRYRQGVHAPKIAAGAGLSNRVFVAGDSRWSSPTADRRAADYEGAGISLT